MAKLSTVKFGATKDLVHPSNAAADPDLSRQLTSLKVLNRYLRVTSVGRTFVLNMDYTSRDPARAAEIANAYRNAYLLEQLNSHIEMTQSARSWLLAAQKFKADNDLFATKETLISETAVRSARHGSGGNRASPGTISANQKYYRYPSNRIRSDRVPR
jgi:uncharacterized protein involved in exopolysaccharide biosynthesis